MSGWWKRGGTSIQPPVPTTRAWPGRRAAQRAISVARAPPSKASRTLSSTSTPRGVSTPMRRDARPGCRGPSARTRSDTPPTSNSAPPPTLRCVRSGRTGPVGCCAPRSTCTDCTSPTAPSAISSRIRTIAGWKRVHIASIANTPAALGERRRSPGSPSGVTVNAFSTSTAFPARSAAQRDRPVLRVRRGDVEDVDLRVVDDRAVGVVDAADLVLGRRRPRRAPPTARRPRPLGAGDVREVRAPPCPRSGPARRLPRAPCRSARRRRGAGRACSARC